MASKKVIDYSGMQVYTEEVKKLIEKMIADSSEFEFITADSYLNFPIIGDVDKLYVDSGANKTYRWDDTNLKYYCIGSDYEDISRVDGSF